MSSGGYRHGKRRAFEMNHFVEPEPMIEYAPPYRERVVFVEETGPDQYIKLVISGPITSDTLESLISFLDHQKRRIEAELRGAVGQSEGKK